MDTLRGIARFYRLQFSILRTWQPSRGATIRRIVVAFVVSFLGLTVTAWLVQGITATGLLPIVAAVIVLGAFNLLFRPLVLATFASLSVILVIVATVVLQILGFLVVSFVVNGYEVASWLAAFVGSFVYAAVTTILSAILSADDDTSYWATLVQQLSRRRADTIRTDTPGVVIVQIDGLAHPILRNQVRAGRVPFIASKIRDGSMRLDRWEALLPSQTSASQAGILHGNNSFIPAFRWWEKARGYLMVSNHPADAAEIVRRASNGEGLLSNDGASVGNLVSGDAARSYITMATIQDRSQGLGRSRSFYSFFASPTSYLDAVVRAVAEIVKEYWQAAHQRRADMVPRMHRGMPYPIARAGTNVLLRSLSTALVMEEVYRGTPVIYVDYTDYDEIAHHSGPERSETLDALDGVDRVLRTLDRAMRSAPRPYRMVVLSDHGQSLGPTFLQRYGVTLEDVVAGLMGGAKDVRAATDTGEQYGTLNAFLSEASRTSGVTGAITRTAFGGQSEGGVVDLGAAATPTKGTDGKGEKGELPELVVCGSGNLGLISFPRLPGRVTLEALDATWPGLVEGLARHPGVGFVVVLSESRGNVAVGARGIRLLDEDRVEGEDPLAPFDGHAIEGVRRVAGMEHCPDILAISLLDPDTDEVAAFEELIGSHGGLGGPQTKPFILHPADWTIDKPLVGAEAVYRQLRRWIESAGIELGKREEGAA